MGTMRNSIRTLLLTATFVLWSGARAQLAVNPQVGLNYTRLTNTPAGLDSNASVGWQLGMDLRVGDRFYFQPGAYFGRSVTLVTYQLADTSLVEDDLVRTSARLKALAGFNLIHSDAFRLRINAGPTYEALLSVDHTDDRIQYNRDDYASGSFNMDVGLGIDLWILTLEGGSSYGLSNAYRDTGALQGDAKYFTYYTTLGIVIGGGRR